MPLQTGDTEKLTLSFPKDLVKRVKRKVPKGKLSRFVAEATREKLDAEEKAVLRKQLMEGYTVRANLHRQLTSEFFEAEEEAYGRYDFHGETERKAKSK